MKFKHLLGSACGLALIASVSTFAAPDPNFHIYLAFGQSNMEGQGNIEQQDKTVDKRFQMMATTDNCNGRKLGTWNDAVPPLANCYGKLGPADYFGRTMVEKTDGQIRVGVIVVAVAGCDIGLFQKNNYRSFTGGQSWYTDRVNAYGGNPYGRLIEMAKKAQEDGVIKGIIFHQGETNAGDGNWASKVKGVYDDIIKDLGLDDGVPFLAGEVLRSGSSSGANNNIAKLPQQSKNFYVISSEGFNQALGDGQNVHFTSQEYRDFGKRYAEKMLDVLGDKVKPVEPVASSSSEDVTSSSSDVIAASSAVMAIAEHAQGSDFATFGKVINQENRLLLPINMAFAGNVNVKIYSSLGKVILDIGAQLRAGENMVLLEKSKLPSGIYAVSVQVENSRMMTRVNLTR